MNENEDCLVQHIAAAIELRLHEVRESDALKTLNPDVSERAVNDAAGMVLQRLCRSRISVEEVKQWGQRAEPPLRAFLRQTKELWVEAFVGGVMDVSAHEPVGIYLGSSLVLVVYPNVAQS